MKLLLLVVATVFADDSGYDSYGGRGHGGGGYANQQVSGYRRENGYGLAPTGAVAVKTNYGSYGHGGYGYGHARRGSSVQYKKSYNCWRKQSYGYSNALQCGQGYEAFTCQLRGHGHAGHAHGHNGGYGGHGGYGGYGHGGHGVNHFRHSTGKSYGYSNGGYGGRYAHDEKRRKKRMVSGEYYDNDGYDTKPYAKAGHDNGYGGGYGGYGGYGNSHGGHGNSYGNTVTCYRGYNPLECTEYGYGYNKKFKCVESGSSHYGSGQSYNGHGHGGHGGYGGYGNGGYGQQSYGYGRQSYGHHSGGYGGSYGKSYSSYGSYSNHGGYGGSHGGYGRHGAHGGVGHHGGNGGYGHGGVNLGGHGGGYGKGHGYNLLFGLKDVHTKAGEKDTNANNCKKECWLDAYGKQNCKIKCCNWQCPHVCIDLDCCKAKNRGDQDKIQACRQDIEMNKKSCHFSCYVQSENLDKKKGQYHISQTFGSYKNAEQNAVKSAFNTYAKFYKDPEKYHTESATVLTQDQLFDDYY